ncbi:MAG: hypothetical protein MUF69_12225, partial [Desulfobacterota bacterium]|nr:hypothetical protein [Thermodesulfobacteriota bacterium]
MTPTLKKRSGKAGLPPGALIHVGERRSERTRITLLDYGEDRYEEREIEQIEECLLYRDSPAVTWISVSGLHQVDRIEKLNECFGLHPLVIEDILNTDQRPKLEDFGSYMYIVLKMIYPAEPGPEFITEQVSLILDAHLEADPGLAASARHAVPL